MEYIPCPYFTYLAISYTSRMLSRRFVFKEAIMVKVLLDIGAGDTSFAKDFKSFNPRLKFLYLCGDKRFQGSWSGDAASAGVRKMFALYSAFNVPDQSLDIVTLNATNLFEGSTKGIESELVRTLKPGGVFFAAHPIGMSPHIDEHIFKPVLFPKHEDGSTFVRVGFGKRGVFFPRWTSLFVLPNGAEVEYPASPAIRNRIKYLYFKEIGMAPPSQGYIYRSTDEPPTVRVWMRM